MQPFKPTRQQLLEAFGKPIPDIIDRNLNVLFCGINPGLYSGATGKHFARPGNKFWKALHEGGFTNKQFSPFEGEELLNFKLGITNLVNRTTAAASEIHMEEYLAGTLLLKEKIKHYSPKVLAVLGIGAFRSGFGMPKGEIGLQEIKIDKTFIWVLPNPSGLNAHFHSKDFAKLFSDLRRFSLKIK